MVTRSLLKRTAVFVDTAASGEECVHKVRQNVYDLILLDYMMPQMDGIDTIRELKKDVQFHIPVIALTADAVSYTHLSNYQKALQTSFQDDQYKMNTSTSSLVNDWEYLGACLFERARANDTPTKYIKNLTVYGKKDLPEGMVDKYRFLGPEIFEGTDNSLKNAQKKVIDQINKFVTVKEAPQLSDSNRCV